MRSAMTAVSVDLAYRKYSDIGIAVLRESSTGIDVSFPDLNTESIHDFFRYKAEITRRQLRQLLRQGRVSLLIGISFVVVCLLAADVVREFASGPFATILHESLIIVGWVAMWRPLQIFLYDW